jgi:hypothetical protein
MEKRETLSTEMNFFSNVVLTVNWSAVQAVSPPSGFMWTGTVVGAQAGRANMVISGNNITGSVNRGDGWIYEIRTTADGKAWVREVDQSKFPQEGPPLVPNRQ